MRQSRYPPSHAIAQTVAHERTSLTGVRRFFASAGIVVYADERLGMANVARRTWLAPAATRRLSTFLDMATPAVGGLVMSPTGVQPKQLDVGGAASAAGRLREIAEANVDVSREPHRKILCQLEESPDPDWEWMGVLRYDHPYRLRTGQYVTSRPHVVFHVRGDAEPTRAHVLVEVQRPTDLDRVLAWAANLLPASERWGILPFALLPDSRHEEIRSVVGAIGNGGEVMVANPNTQREEGGTRTDDAQIAEFVQSVREARYSTVAQGLDSLISRAESVDHALLAAFDLYHWSGTDSRRSAVRVRLKQHGTDPLTIEWGAAREPTTAGGTPLPGPLRLTAETWDQMTSTTWSEDQRMAHLRGLWSRLIHAVQDAANSAAAA